MLLTDTVLYAGYTATDVEGNVYKTVLIGNQRWMTKNLKVTKFNDGAPIPVISGNTAWEALTTPGYCWYDYDAGYKEPYGALYNWYTVGTGNLAPAGWHVPTGAEWGTLEAYLGGASVAGGKLKVTGTEHWNSPNTGATNESGFSAFPGGYRSSSEAFAKIGVESCGWSATGYSETFAYIFELAFNSVRSFRYGKAKFVGLGVRCLRD